MLKLFTRLRRPAIGNLGAFEAKPLRGMLSRLSRRQYIGKSHRESMEHMEQPADETNLQRGSHVFGVGIDSILVLRGIAENMPPIKDFFALGGMLSRIPRENMIVTNPTAKAWNSQRTRPVFSGFACFRRGSCLNFCSARDRRKH